MISKDKRGSMGQMKYVILIGDGMSDNPVEELGGRTPLEYASTTSMDWLASNGELGLFRSVPEGFPPGSDVANLSIFGYDPKLYYTGRAPLEAASIGVVLGPEEVAFRCNLVTLSGTEDSPIMADYSAGHITTEEAGEIIKSLDEAFVSEGVRFYPGKSYRHLMVWKDGSDRLRTTPPHDISGRAIEGHLPEGEGADFVRTLMARSVDMLRDHPVNMSRRGAGRNTADSIWLWGQGRAPEMPTFRDRFDLDGAIISAVDLMNGIGVYAGLDVIKVPGVTGYIDTNYTGKAEYALKALESRDVVCIHVEAPDEAGHQGSLEDKIRAIEDFDRLVVGRVMEGLKAYAGYRVMVITDHPTPVALRTHTSDPVPYAIYGTGVRSSSGLPFSERHAGATGLFKEDPGGFVKDFLGR